jgi:hypothetical protein
MRHGKRGLLTAALVSLWSVALTAEIQGAIFLFAGEQYISYTRAKA